MFALDEPTRIAALQDLEILDSAPEPLFDRLTELAALTFDAPISLISLVDVDRQWFKAGVGVGITETPRELSFCAHAIKNSQVMVVPDTTLDPRFRENPLVTGFPNVRFYAGAPLITPEGAGIGTLCVLDDKPRPAFNPEQQAKLRSFADSVMQALLLRRRARETEQVNRLAAERLRLLSLAERVTELGAWSWRRGEAGVTWSDEVYRLFGLGAGGASPRLEDMLAHYHPEDAIRIRAAIDRALTAGEDYRLEAEITLADGRRRDTISHGVAQRDAQGAVIGLYGAIQDVTAMRLADRDLRANEARARALTENSTDLIVRTSPDGVILEVSPAIRRYGIEPDDLVGRNAISIAHPDDIAKARAARDDNRSGQPPNTNLSREFRLGAADGREVWIQGNPTPICDAQGKLIEVISILRDITPLKEGEFALAASERRYRLLAENATDIIVCYTPTREVTFLSPAVEGLLGYRPEELIGKSATIIIHPEDVPGVLARFADYVAAGPDAPAIRFEYRGQRKDGSLTWLEAHPKAIRDPETGEIIEFQDTVRDISARKALETELAETRDAALKATAVKSQFLANMSHEIRTPLTAILGYANLLQARTGLDELTRAQTGRIAAAGEALLSIVNDVLDFSKLEAGQFEIAPRPAPVASCLTEAMALFSPQAHAKGIELKLALDDTLPDWVSLDPDRLRQILLNLIGNAVKFTDSGSVRLVARHDARRDRLTVAIEDTGPGLTAEQQQGLFQRFSQVDSSTTRRHGGTGLGLAICKALAEAMGGGIKVRSAPGQGAVFEFNISAPRVSGPEAKGEADAPPTLDGIRLLVVDDNEVNRHLTRAVLEPFGVLVTEAADGQAGVNLALDAPVDLILMDIRMPGLSGPEALSAIRASAGPNQTVPILAFTADADLGWLDAAGAFQGVIRKPIEPMSLAQAIFDAAYPEAA